MFVLPTLTIKLVYSATISGVGFISATKQYLILLTHLVDVILEESSLHIVVVTVSGCSWHLDKRFLFSLNILSSLEVVYPSQRNDPIDRLLILQIHILMLVNSTTTPTIHHYLLIFIDSITTFSTW